MCVHVCVCGCMKVVAGVLNSLSILYIGGCFGRDSITRSIRTGKSGLYAINTCTYPHVYVHATSIGPFTLKVLSGL